MSNSASERVYVPRIYQSFNSDGVRTSSKSTFPSVKTDKVYQVDKRSTWRKVEVCPCFKEVCPLVIGEAVSDVAFVQESFYPQVVSLFDCLNANFGERSACAAQQTDVDNAIIADIRAKRMAEQQK
jgi:hypothetical protein